MLGAWHHCSPAHILQDTSSNEAIEQATKVFLLFFGRRLGRVLHTLGKKEKLKQNREIFGLSEMTQLFMVVIIGILYRIVESRWNHK